MNALPKEVYYWLGRLYTHRGYLKAALKTSRRSGGKVFVVVINDGHGYSSDWVDVTSEFRDENGRLK